MIHVLYLDDEEHNLTAFRAAFRRDFHVHVTTVPSEAVRILQEQPIEVVISDQKMPDISGVEFFEMIMADHPDPVRMLLTGHADIDAVIDAINKGRIYKYISKPWNEAELKRLVEEAAELCRVRRRSSKLNASYAKFAGFARGPVCSQAGGRCAPLLASRGQDVLGIHLGACHPLD